MTAFYVFFGEYCLFAYGYSLTDPIITASLPYSTTTYIIEVLFCLNLVFTYPLMIYPANNVIESYLYKGWPKSRKRQMCKNLNRFLMVIFTVIVAIWLGPNLDKFLSVLGGVACAPIAFIFPALFHSKIAETPRQKKIDLVIVAVAVVLAIFSSVMAIVTWNG